MGDFQKALKQLGTLRFALQIYSQVFFFFTFRLEQVKKLIIFVFIVHVYVCMRLLLVNRHACEMSDFQSSHHPNETDTETYWDFLSRN